MYTYERYMTDVAGVATLNANLDMATKFIYDFHLMTKEDVKGTCWEAIHADLPLSPMDIAIRVHEVLPTSERLPTLLGSVRIVNERRQRR